MNTRLEFSSATTSQGFSLNKGPRSRNTEFERRKKARDGTRLPQRDQVQPFGRKPSITLQNYSQESTIGQNPERVDSRGWSQPDHQYRSKEGHHQQQPQQLSQNMSFGVLQPCLGPRPRILATTGRILTNDQESERPQSRSGESRGCSGASTSRLTESSHTQSTNDTKRERFKPMSSNIPKPNDSKRARRRLQQYQRPHQAHQRQDTVKLSSEAYLPENVRNRLRMRQSELQMIKSQRRKRKRSKKRRDFVKESVLEIKSLRETMRRVMGSLMAYHEGINQAAEKISSLCESRNFQRFSQDFERGIRAVNLHIKMIEGTREEKHQAKEASYTSSRTTPDPKTKNLEVAEKKIEELTKKASEDNIKLVDTIKADDSALSAKSDQIFHLKSELRGLQMQNRDKNESQNALEEEIRALKAENSHLKTELNSTKVRIQKASEYLDTFRQKMRRPLAKDVYRPMNPTQIQLLESNNLNLEFDLKHYAKVKQYRKRLRKILSSENNFETVVKYQLADLLIKIRRILEDITSSMPLAFFDDSKFTSLDSPQSCSVFLEEVFRILNQNKFYSVYIGARQVEDVVKRCLELGSVRMYENVIEFRPVTINTGKIWIFRQILCYGVFSALLRMVGVGLGQGGEEQQQNAASRAIFDKSQSE